jgi:opacity protein-like surface antigen
MTHLSRLLLAATVLVAPSAFAADYDPPIVVDEAPEYQPVEIGSGWYLRGDIGYGMGVATGTATYRTYDSATATYSDNSFATSAISTGFNGGIGFGYRFTDYLRADATVDYLRGRFDGTTVSATPCLDPIANPGYASTTCRSEDSATFEALSPMVNAYADLGTYAGFTPYLGAGVGLAFVRWNDLTNEQYCVDGGAVCPAPAYIGATTHAGESSWRFAWAAMAGVSYDVSKNTKIDVGYKYRHISGGNMFGFDSATASAGATGVQGKDGGFSQHEVRVGLRYEIW